MQKSQHGVSDDAYRTVSAFANTTGGMLVFGVKDSQGQLDIVG
jgi:ATP-dependent DNA helicase RecG